MVVELMEEVRRAGDMEAGAGQRQASSESEHKMIAEMGRLALDIDNLKNIQIRELMLTDKQTALRKLDALIAETENKPAGDAYRARLVAKRGALRAGISELFQPLVWEGSAGDCKRYVEFVFERVEIAMKKDRSIGAMARALALSRDVLETTRLGAPHDAVTIAQLTGSLRQQKTLAVAYADVPISSAFDVAVPHAIQEPVDELLHQFMTLARDRVEFACAHSGADDVKHMDAVAFALAKAVGEHVLDVGRAGGVTARDIANGAAHSKRPEVQESIIAEHVRAMADAGIPVGGSAEEAEAGARTRGTGPLQGRVIHSREELDRFGREIQRSAAAELSAQRAQQQRHGLAAFEDDVRASFPEADDARARAQTRKQVERELAKDWAAPAFPSNVRGYRAGRK
jgi:hypothetical protein